MNILKSGLHKSHFCLELDGKFYLFLALIFFLTITLDKLGGYKTVIAYGSFCNKYLQ